MAAVVSTLFVILFYRSGAGALGAKRVWLFLFLAMASHGALDALTKGGLGVAFFAPFSPKRYFFPYRPLLVSPLSINQFLTSRGVAILVNEMRWVWAPSVGLAVIVLMLRSWLRPRARPRPTVKPRPAPRIAPAPPRAPAPPQYPPPPSPAPPPARQAALLLQATLASLVRHRGRLVLIGAAIVVIGAGVFVALQPVPPPPTVVEQPPAQVAPPPPAPPPPKPLQADVEGYYLPGYQFSIGRFRFTSFTLRPEAVVTFTESGTRAKRDVGCVEAVIGTSSVRLRCEDPRVAFVTIEGTFPRRMATEHLDAPVVSAVVTVRSATGEVLYRARDSFTWHPID
jgi:hypothetical protein